MMDAKTLKESLSVDDIVNIVVNGLGSNGNLWDKDGNPIFNTICHNAPGEGKYKLYYYAESQMFHCYTQCGDSFDIYELIIRAGKADSFVEAYRYCQDFFGIGRIGEDLEDAEKNACTEDWDLLNKYAALDGEKPAKIAQDPQPLPNSLLEYFSPILPAKWKAEGISCDIMDKFGIRMDLSMEKIIIPHRSEDGSLIGIRGRSYNQYELADGKKYAPVYIENTMYNHMLGEHLYGLYENQDTIRRVKKALIFEGEKSVLKAGTFYGDNNYTVASCGSSISDKQIELLLSLGVTEVVIAFDKENKGAVGSPEFLKYQEKLQGLAAKFAMYVNTYYILDKWDKLEYKDSPIDKGQEVFEFLLKNKVFVPSTTNCGEKRRRVR